VELQQYVDELRHQLVVAAGAGGDEARAMAERLVAAIDPATRLTLQDALAAAAQEITCELAPGSVELRLRGRDPEFVVSVPRPDAAPAGEPESAVAWAPADDEGATARINVRMPEQLKARVDAAAADAQVSVNTWLVRAAASALERTDPGRRREPRAPTSSQRFTGWAR
jgi:hypothetical protein